MILFLEMKITLKECISSGFVSYVGNFVNIFENKYANTQSPNIQLQHQERLPYIWL